MLFTGNCLLFNISYNVGNMKSINELHDWEMFKVFAKLYPVEAYDSRPDDTDEPKNIKIIIGKYCRELIISNI